MGWYEHRQSTRRIRYAGPTARIRIAKGLYWRMGDLAVQRVTQDELRLIDNGTIYLTSKRMIFMGERGNKTIRYSAILDFTPHQNGRCATARSHEDPYGISGIAGCRGRNRTSIKGSALR